MKAIMVMYDSLCKQLLPSYGCDWVKAPNFSRLAEKTATFDRAYVGSMPCMPARRELHTGRYNFLHTSWGALEPFDDSVPAILDRAGVYTHLVSDHYHYWEDGGSTYHSRYSSWEAVRGQEGDHWKPAIRDPEVPESLDIFRHTGKPGPHALKSVRHDWINRAYMTEESNQPQSRTFDLGLDFLAENHAEDQWFLTIETFDPHEPFFTQESYKALYPHRYQGPHFDWPKGGPADDDPDLLEHVRCQYAALVSMCDAKLGLVLDAMDRYDLWKDTLLIVNTDHGFLLGEHDLYGKRNMPWYNEISNIPLFVWDPRYPACAGARRQSLVQTIDLSAGLLEFFDVELPPDMQGRPISRVVAEDEPIRDSALFGLFGGQVNITDGRFVYMRGPAAPDNQPLNRHTVMPMHMANLYPPEELRNAELGPAFPFTKGVRPLRIPASENPKENGWGTLLFDVETDPEQREPLSDPDIEARMEAMLSRALADSDAPAEQWQRLGLSKR